MRAYSMETFNPKNVNEYNIEELMEFIKNDKVSIPELQRCGLKWNKQLELYKIKAGVYDSSVVDSFDPRRINEYSIVELMEFLENGVATFDDFRNCGLQWDKQIKLRDMPSHQDIIAGMIMTKPQELFDDMRQNPMKYKANVMQVLFGKIPPTEAMKEDDSLIGLFLKAGLTLTFGDLYRNGILPEGNSALEKAIFKDDYGVPYPTIGELGEVSTDRNDVMFVGCPGSGKTCMLAGLLTYLHYRGEMCYVPLRNSRGVDSSLYYWKALINGLSEYKVTRSAGINTVSYMQFDIGPRRDREITTMELNAEAFSLLLEAGCTGKEVWEKLGLGGRIKNMNFKTLFFLLDYSTIIGKNPVYSEIDQARILDNTLLYLSHDGVGLHGEKNCTVSKVKTVAIVITKSDLMDVEEGRPLSSEERADIAYDYLNSRYKYFINNLSNLCKKYCINANNKGHAYEPFVTTFRLGKFYVGNTVVFDETDSKRLADFIVRATERRHHRF